MPDRNVPVDRNVPEGATAAAVLLHPHPDHGGNRHNSVVTALWDALPSAGVGVVRFDFRSSDFDEAVADTIAALDATDVRPLVLCGYSFGAIVASLVVDERIAGWFLVAPPFVDPFDGSSPIGPDPRPKMVAIAEHDQFAPPTVARPKIEGWTNTEVDVIPGADHFLAGRLGAITMLAEAFTGSLSC